MYRNIGWCIYRINIWRMRLTVSNDGGYIIILYLWQHRQKNYNTRVDDDQITSKIKYASLFIFHK